MGGMFGEDVFVSAFSSGEEGATMNTQQPLKAAPVEKRLPCNLEDLYKGTSKKMKISREVLDASGKITTVEEISINVRPGWKKGTKITFPKKGNEAPHIIPADLVFIIDEKPHNVFTREGNDLIATQKISLVEALTDYTVQLTTPYGRNLAIPLNSVIHPTHEEVVHREGMLSGIKRLLTP
ncbi:hypothetical protein OPV22_020289 [Ensete ventricosum]|uniref:Chaperone DnaJ C-terminal domain-containing protein n=1 Tax=Ensete ventricosum TaxID=4639 RepID=A0AAV8QEB5_ENSVE|nr:hypothetical protein OPV22_020289 [Ensete ventricosum]